MNLSSKGPLTDAQVASFRENGFLILDNLYSEKDAEEFCATMLYLVKSLNCPGVQIPSITSLSQNDRISLLLDSLMTLENTNHRYISLIYDTIRETPALRKMLMNERFCDSATQLLGLPLKSPLYTQQAACRIDVPKDTAFFLDWHQEVHYVFKDSDLIQLWAPALHDIDLQNGALRVLVGSHKAGIAKTIDMVPEFGHAQYTVVPEVVSQYKEIQVCLKFGQGLIFDKQLIHKSGVNSTNRPRLTLLCHYHNAARAEFFEHIRPQGVTSNPYKDKTNPSKIETTGKHV